jgi:hypothetical protein
VTSAEHGADGRVEILADADRPGGWLLTVDRIRQSYVDLDDPTYLDFEYVQAMAEAIDALPEGPLAVTHVGGGGCTLARYVAATRPGSPQLVLEPDVEVTALVRAKLPLPPRSRIRVRAAGGRPGVSSLRTASADVLVLDAFSGGRVPQELTTLEFFTEVARVLRPSGIFLANIADGPPLVYSRRLAATVRSVLPTVLVTADPAVLKGRRFGNIVLAAGGSGLPVEAIRRAAAGAPFLRLISIGFGRDARPLRDDDALRSPVPPEELWRVGHWEDG